MENLNLVAISVAIVVGTITRLMLLKDDYRNYPSFPNGYLIHLTIGFIAASLGSVAAPALLNEDYVAVTFLALAIQHFREVRRMERDSLLDLEQTEIVPRGSAYIDGLAKSFEARNYVVLLTSLVTSASIILIPTYPWLRVIFGITLGFSVKYSIFYFTKSDTLGDVADISIHPLKVEGDNIYVEHILIANIGLEQQKEWIVQNGIGVLIKPKGTRSQITLANYGTRQAVLHEVARILGIRRYYGSRRDFGTGNVGFFAVLIDKDQEALLKVIKNIPLLESVRRKKLA